MATKKKKETIAIAGKWPKVDIGSHLTVIRYENGVTTLEWDDEALQRDVNEAIASLSVTPTRKRKTKE